MKFRPKTTLALRAALLALAVSLGVMWPIALKRGESRGREKNQVHVANDGAFYCLSGLQALEGSDKHRLLLQIALDGEALKLEDLPDKSRVGWSFQLQPSETSAYVSG